MDKAIIIPYQEEHTPQLKKHLQRFFKEVDWEHDKNPSREALAKAYGFDDIPKTLGAFDWLYMKQQTKIKKMYQFEDLKNIAFNFKGEHKMKALDYSGEKLLIDVNRTFQVISIQDIFYLECQGNKVIYHLINENITSYKSITQVEKELLNYPFVKISQSYIINIMHIKEMKIQITKLSTVTMRRGEVLPIARRFASKFRIMKADFFEK